jgi:hypothetical protein
VTQDVPQEHRDGDDGRLAHVSIGIHGCINNGSHGDGNMPMTVESPVIDESDVMEVLAPFTTFI